MIEIVDCPMPVSFQDAGRPGPERPHPRRRLPEEREADQGRRDPVEGGAEGAPGRPGAVGHHGPRHRVGKADDDSRRRRQRPPLRQRPDEEGAAEDEAGPAHEAWHRLEHLAARDHLGEGVGDRGAGGRRDGSILHGRSRRAGRRLESRETGLERLNRRGQVGYPRLEQGETVFHGPLRWQVVAVIRERRAGL